MTTLLYLSRVLHLSVEDDDPGHDDPPFLGAGLLQDLDLVLVPVSVLHEPQEPQVPQLPLTGPWSEKNDSVVVGPDKK